MSGFLIYSCHYEPRSETAVVGARHALPLRNLGYMHIHWALGNPKTLFSDNYSLRFEDFLEKLHHGLPGSLVSLGVILKPRNVSFVVGVCESVYRAFISDELVIHFGIIHFLLEAGYISEGEIVRPALANQHFSLDVPGVRGCRIV